MGGRWFSRRAIGLHVALAVVVPTFALLFLWQVRRATGGNELSWAYVFEWPFFTGYAGYMWWKLLHEAPDGPGEATAPAQAREPGSVGPAAVAPDPPAATHPAAAHPAAAHAAEPHGAGTEDEELAAYNRYLAELNASGRRKRW